ncbi:phosphotransferase family protein [Oceanobacillus longus]|uniref:Phosphotransferase family protein n=1 Tax=Oceanobacillus longus TaxID=930120 RepID=A0ABV8GZP1_9BACI
MITLQTHDLKSVLMNYISKNILKQEDTKLIEFFQPTGGWSDEAYVLTLSWDNQGMKEDQGFVVRKAKSGGLMSAEKDLFPQFAILDKLNRHSNLPVPKVYVFEKDKSILGNEFFVMEKIEGTSYVPWSREGRAFFEKAAKGEIPAQFAKYLAGLHNLDVHSLELDQSMLKANVKNYLDSKIQELEKIYKNYKFVDDPIVTDAIEWLKVNKPNPVPLSIIHNDYRTGNLMYKDDEITGILDWEAAEVGDPRMDIAYVCAKANRMDSPLLSYLIEKNKFFTIYQGETDSEFSEEEIFYFEVYHQLKFLMISLSAAHAFMREGSSDLRMARQGFRLTLMKNMLAELLGY